MLRLICLSAMSALLSLSPVVLAEAADQPLKIATFDVDVTPPLGSALCDGLVPPAKSVADPLQAKGIVLLSSEKPIVLVAFDWVGIGNSGYDEFREAVAKAVGTTRERVAIHSLHQHDAPGCDFATEELLATHHLPNEQFNVAFARVAMQRLAEAAAAAVKNPQTVTHVGYGVGKVEKVASNRRVMGPDGKVKYVRYSAAKDEKVRAEPEGTIDPDVQLVTFWNGDRALAMISYYATHPQSYYGQGEVSADFVGMARRLNEQAHPGIPQIHFNGASGNVTAGKYNDGAHENRAILAGRMAAGMQLAWKATRKTPIDAGDLEWRVVPVALPLSPKVDVAKYRAVLNDEQAPKRTRVQAARNLVWAQRCQQGDKIDLTCLKLGPGYLVQMPGELFIEYQLAARKMRPDAPVCLAAYGDYGAGYIGTKIAYTQGGYETGPVSRTAPEVEDVLLNGLRALLQVKPGHGKPGDE